MGITENRRAIASAMFERGPIRAQAPLRKSAPRRTDFAGDTGWAWVAQLVERVLGKDEVTGSIPVPGSRNWRLDCGQSRKRAGAE